MGAEELVGRLTDLRSVLAGPVEQVAPTLLGRLLVGGGVTVRLTEVEAYAGVGQDPGSHAHRGQTPRNAVMFGEPGHAYVYFTYGMHWCLNVSTGPAGTAAAVLLRAGEVTGGLELARGRRPGVRDRDLCRGPARLTRTLAVTGEQGGLDLLDPRSGLQLLTGGPPPAGTVRSGPRVGVAGAGATTPWRFWLSDEPTVSAYRAAALPRRTPRAPDAPEEPGATGRTSDSTV